MRRLELGLLQREAAERLGVTEGTVVNWELGHTEPDLRMVPRVVEFLGKDPRPVPTTLAERVHRRRIGLGMTIELLASELGIDPGTLAAWERGCRRPVGKFLAKVSGFLGEDVRP